MQVPRFPPGMVGGLFSSDAMADDALTFMKQFNPDGYVKFPPVECTDDVFACSLQGANIAKATKVWLDFFWLARSPGKWWSHRLGDHMVWTGCQFLPVDQLQISCQFAWSWQQVSLCRVWFRWSSDFAWTPTLCCSTKHMSQEHDAKFDYGAGWEDFSIMSGLQV